MTTTQFKSWLKAEIKAIDDGCPSVSEEQFYDAVASIRQARTIALSLGLIEVVEICDRVNTKAFALPAAQKVLCSCLSKLRQARTNLSPPEVAKQLGVNPGKVLTWIRSGRLKATNVSQSNRPRYRITPEDLDRFRMGRQVAPPQRVRKPLPYRGKIYY